MTKNEQNFAQQSYNFRYHTDISHFWCLKILIEIILVVFKMGIFDLFVILHQMSAEMSASFLLKTSHMSTHRPFLHGG